MKEHVNVGPVPAAEDCAQIDDPDYDERSREECRRFIELIRKKLGPEPTGARLKAKTFPHDFGSYREVVCEYDSDIPEAEEYAMRCESDSPMTWKG